MCAANYQQGLEARTVYGRYGSMLKSVSAALNLSVLNSLVENVEG